MITLIQVKKLRYKYRSIKALFIKLLLIIINKIEIKINHYEYIIIYYGDTKFKQFNFFCLQIQKNCIKFNEKTRI